ncbi:MAG: DUF3006 domain-containing protein [Chloroflexi bacterium]|nr:DUF3006 domain-containing protein [Chloroflexota bacterium]MBU1748809.1 DUF3006 domain-containing protein [Chloroflexota bacterium]MBU1878306.1 DUF3006 domain-containing protein [Chloroflexota bacterium]
MYAVLDRFESSPTGSRLAILVFDDGQRLVVPAAALPPTAREGLALVVTWTIDADETQRRRRRILALQQDVFIA